MSNKPHPERVNPGIALKALEAAGYNWQEAWTQYVLLHYRATGNLAPGCHMRDLLQHYTDHGVENRPRPERGSRHG